MELSEAYEQLFGEDPSRATQEAVDLFRENSDINAIPDEQFMLISVEAQSKYSSFEENPALYVDGCMDHHLKSLLAQLVQKDESDEDNSYPPKQPVTPEKEQQTGNTDPVPPVSRDTKPQPIDMNNLDAAIAKGEASGQGKKKKVVDGDEGSATSTPESEVKPQVPKLVVPPIVQNRNLPAWIRRVHQDAYFQATRKKIEQAYLDSKSDNPTIQADGQKRFAAWKNFMREYADGRCGPENVGIGTHMYYRCIADLEDGADPTDPEYIAYYAIT